MFLTDHGSFQGFPLGDCQLLGVAFLLVAGAAQIYYIPCIDAVKSVKAVAEKIKTMLPKNGTVAFFSRRYDNGWNFYLNRAKIPVLTDAQIKAKQPKVDLIILMEKHLDFLKTVLNMDHCKMAAIEPLGSRRFVLLKKVPGAKGIGYEITHCR